MPIGYSGVANYALTTAGTATGVVAVAHTGYGDDVAGGGVVDLYSVGPTGPSYLLLENGGYLLQENGSKILLE